ncbi:MAG: hypothetical protein KAX49_06160 [Halanaerobiales bacterium]|nr:hypothetical protein [Halanaerobiales bacterium]
MLGAELIKLDKSPATEEMKERGFLLGKNGPGRNVLAFQPPLIIIRENIDEAIENLDQVLAMIHASEEKI